MSSEKSGRDRSRSKVLKIPGVQILRRPATAGSPEFDMGYARTGPRGTTPVVVLPGGPGLASILPYAVLRRQASKIGLDVIMIEHRGVGLSRTDVNETDLPSASLTIHAVLGDVAAVLDTENIERAVIYGSSYGSYLAQAFGVRYPERVAGMVLDSLVLSAHDYIAVRAHARSLLWTGSAPRTARLARKIRSLVDTNSASMEEVGTAVRIAFEFGGPTLTERLVDQFANGRANRTWSWLNTLGRNDTDQISPFIMEYDLVGVIAYRELNYSPVPDGGPFDPGTDQVAAARRFPGFSGEPYDLADHLPDFHWPVAILSGERDLRTPSTVARQTLSLLPDARLVSLPDNGHSALDAHQRVALETMRALRDNQHQTNDFTTRITELPRRGPSRHISTMIRTRLAAESIRHFPHGKH